MNLENESGIGRYISGCTLCTVALSLTVFVGYVFLVVVPQIGRDIKLYISLVVNLMAAFAETGNRIRQG
jgi:hypothetical protein